MDFFINRDIQKVCEERQNKAFQLVMIEDEIGKNWQRFYYWRRKRRLVRIRGFINLNSETSNI